jgi:phosphopantetheinyl transferase (holo-ACP synthase)
MPNSKIHNINKICQLIEINAVFVVVYPLIKAAEAAVSVLTPLERKLASKLGDKRLPSFHSSRFALKQLGKHFAPETLLEEIETVHRNSPKPACRLPDGRNLVVSVSHDDSYVAAALSLKNAPIGIDVERIDERAVRAMKRFISDWPDSPEAATRLWSAYEAVVKCANVPLSEVLRHARHRRSPKGDLIIRLPNQIRFRIKQVVFNKRIFSLAIPASDQ